jgi:exonuclease SbcD
MATLTPIRFMHFSDVHFGVENYGKLDPATGLSTRLIDFRKSLLFCIKTALNSGIELAIFTGDAYKSRDPSQTHQREFAACLSVLTSAGIPIVLLTGNHDISNARGRANSIEIFGALASEKITVVDRPAVIKIETSLGRSVQIAALPYLTKSNILASDELSGQGVADTTENIVKRYEEAVDNLATRCSKAPDLPTIFMGHFSVSSAKVGALQRSYLTNEPEVSKSALAIPELVYVALGHIHKFQDLSDRYQPPIVYSGSIDRIDFGERSEGKGFVLVDFSRHNATYKFIESPVRQFLDIDVDTSRGGDPTDRVVEALAKEELEEAVVKLVYHVRPEDEPMLDERRIRAALSRAFICVAVRKEIVSPEKTHVGIDPSEALTPLQAFEMYLDRHPELEKKREDLTSRATILIQELISEEST